MQKFDPIHVGRPNIGNREAFLGLVGEILDRRWLSNNGPVVQSFEQRVASFLGVRNCVAMCNGTVALEIAIRALELEGEVIVPSYTFIATAHALSWQGIKPVFADINAKTHNLDPSAVRRMINRRTKGIIGVHLWGRGAPVDELQQIADEHGLPLFFDAAHAFACTKGGVKIGNFGRAEVLSFHATKFFNTFEGGAVVTNDDELAEKMRLMRNFGFAGFDNVTHLGTNGKMIEICAAMGLVNLDYIDTVVNINKLNFEMYRQGLKDIAGLQLIEYDESEENNFQYVVLEVDTSCKKTRDEIVASLHENGVLARKYFWPGCHRMNPYRELQPDASATLPNTEEVASRVMVMPTGTTLAPSEIERICGIVRGAVG